MARTLQQAINDLNATQNLHDRTTMELGQLYAKYYLTKDKKLLIPIDEKAEMIGKIENRKREIEKEIYSLGG